MDSPTFLAVIAFTVVFVMDLSVIFLIVKERLWRDDNAVLICNLMVAFLFHNLWQIYVLLCDSFRCPFEALHMVIVLLTVAHVAILLTLVFLSYDRCYALKKKTLIKIHSRPFAARRIVCVWLVAFAMAAVTAASAALVSSPDSFYTLFLIFHCSSFVAVMTVILICFILVWRLHRHNYKTAVGNGLVEDPAWRRTHNTSLRLSLTVASLAIGQCITWIPIYTYMLAFQRNVFSEEQQNPLFVTFLFLNFFSAPLLVFVFSDQFRQYFKRQILCCLYLDNQELSWIDDTLRSSFRQQTSHTPSLDPPSEDQHHDVETQA